MGSQFNSKRIMLLGLKGADGGGVPAGGTTGQVLKKHSNTDQDVEWGDGLPTVTASDNGKFLKVVNGVWAAATLPTYNGESEVIS